MSTCLRKEIVEQMEIANLQELTRFEVRTIAFCRTWLAETKDPEMEIAKNKNS